MTRNFTFEQQTYSLLSWDHPPLRAAGKEETAHAKDEDTPRPYGPLEEDALAR